MLQSINTILAHFHDIAINHIYRWHNKYVDSLSKEALSTEVDLMLWEESIEVTSVQKGSSYFLYSKDVDT